MKRSSVVLASSLIALMTAGQTWAADSISGEITEDLYFAGGVLLADVELPENQSADTGASKVTIEGTGSVAVGNQSGGGFPRIWVAGGTTITSNRDWTNKSGKSWWNGQFAAPSSARLPREEDVTIPGGNNLEVVDAFGMGIADAKEEFSFSPGATLVLPVSEQDGQKLMITYKNGDTYTAATNDFCIVSEGFCQIDSVAKFQSIALVKELFDQCPRTSIANGAISGTPTCIVTCDRDFELSEDGQSCESLETGEGLGEEDLGGDLQEGPAEEDYSEETYYEDPEPQYFPEGYFRFTGASEQKNRYLDEEGLSGDELERVRMLNRGTLSQNRNEGTVTKEKKNSASKSDDNGFLNYMLQMRNHFGSGSNANVVRSAETSEEVVEGALEESGEAGGSFNASAPLLPSTGPEIFATIAIIGILMMLFGARRKN